MTDSPRQRRTFGAILSDIQIKLEDAAGRARSQRSWS